MTLQEHSGRKRMVDHGPALSSNAPASSPAAPSPHIVTKLARALATLPSLMSHLWHDVLVAIKRKRHGDEPTMDKRNPSTPGPSDADFARQMVATQNSIITSRLKALHKPPKAPEALTHTVLDASKSAPATFKDETDYDNQRKEVMKRERVLGFDYACLANASKEEEDADKILQILRRRDVREVYDKQPPRTGYAGQKHKRRPGDHFLSNVELIEDTDVFRVAKEMPKGAHLHIHFNSCLKPKVLLDVAKDMDRMFIWSNMPLTKEDNYLNYERCEIKFSILAPENEKPGDLFSASYKANQTMPLQTFLDAFPPNHPHADTGFDWLQRKLLFNEDDAHHKLQTSYGAWETFNGRTRMMKGLFNYKSAYRTYTRAMLKDFVVDKIQYAEIRPNFMSTNQLHYDDGTGEINNVGMMEIIIEEYEMFQKENKEGYFAGMKVIYCTPRSFDPGAVEVALNECLAFKKRWPKWIAGSSP
ncbi:hypothetical protein IMZ48_48365, partial [Candidatus Bathyarchaeota archaeon]|nr:hypothetical protein [Candidatus Bathyarchaeota archaeon]